MRIRRGTRKKPESHQNGGGPRAGRLDRRLRRPRLPRRRCNATSQVRHERRQRRQFPEVAGRTAEQCRRGPQNQASDRNSRNGHERARQARSRSSTVRATRPPAAAVNARPHRGRLSEMVAARRHLARLRHPRRNRRQPSARPPGVARPHRPAIVSQDRDSQRHVAPAQGRADDHRCARHITSRHPQKTDDPGRAGRPPAQDRLVRHFDFERLHLGARPAPGNQVHKMLLDPPRRSTTAAGFGTSVPTAAKPCNGKGSSG